MKYAGRRLRRQAGFALAVVLAFCRPLMAQAAESPAPATQPDVQMTLTKQAADAAAGGLGTTDGSLLPHDYHEQSVPDEHRSGQHHRCLEHSV